ncbi:O-antigen polymerase [Flavobacterium aestivum]|uniref:O-antigen polymerase n=1 Tax=Flavobacterium aestivum TaxID=3003257 RepID=UPI002482B5FE|nr:O-antigen polymerase [Flavobacterium aestivum]
MNFNLNKRVNLIFMIFFILSLLFPATVFNKLMFVIIMAFTIINYKIYKLNTFSPFIVFCIFLYGFIFSFFNIVDKGLALQFFLSILVLFLIYPIFKYKIDIDGIVKISGLIMAIYTGISFLILVVFMDLPLSGPYYVFFNDYSSGSNGLREFAEEGTLSFHIGTAPFLYLPFCLFVISYIDKKKISSLLSLIVIFITIFISASRGLILSCIIATIFIIFFKSNLRSKILFLSLSIPLIIISISYLLTTTTIFDSREESNSIKIGHYESFIDHINFFNFFLGEGLASYYYSKGSQSMKAHTEITPLDMLRYFGFIITPILYLVIILPTKRIASYLGSNSLYVILCLIYVVNSFTNPTMFNSYGLLLILWYWYKILNTSNVSSEQIVYV